MSDSSFTPQAPFSIGAAISQPFNLPGGKSFLFRLVGWTAAITTLIYLVFGLPVLKGYMSMVQGLLALGKTEDPSAIFAMMAPVYAVMGWGMLLIVFTWFIKISAETAMHKNIFHGTDHGFFPLRFGIEECRVMLAQVIVAIICYGFYFAAYIVLIILVMIVAVAAESSGAVGVVLGIILAFAVIAMIGTVLMIIIRFAPAAALSVRDNSVKTFEGWKATRKRFWPLFGSYLIVVFAGNLIVGIPVMACLFIALGDASLYSQIPSGANADPAVVIAMFGDIFKQSRVFIPLIIGMALSSLLGIIWSMAIWGVANYAAQLDAHEHSTLEEST